MADDKNCKLQQSIDRARTQAHNLLTKASKELKRLKAERLAQPQAPAARQPTLEAHGPRGAAVTCANSIEELEIRAAEIRARRKTEQTQSEAPAPSQPDYEPSMPPYGHAQGLPGAAPDSVETTPSAAPGSRICAFERTDPMDWEVEAILASMRQLHEGDLVTETGQGHTEAQRQQSQTTPSPAPAAIGKIGRNAACPCNSGKKYKRCCGFSRTEAMKTAA